MVEIHQGFLIPVPDHSWSAVSSGIRISWPYCIQLADGSLVCDPLRVPKNIISCRQLTALRSGIGISWPYCIQLTDDSLVCNPLQVSENLISCRQCDNNITAVPSSCRGLVQFHNNPTSLQQTHDISSGILKKPTTVFRYVPL